MLETDPMKLKEPLVSESELNSNDIDDTDDLSMTPGGVF